MLVLVGKGLEKDERSKACKPRMRNMKRSLAPFGLLVSCKVVEM